MNPILIDNYSIYFDSELEQLRLFFQEHNYDNCFLLMDTGSFAHCFQPFIDKFPKIEFIPITFEQGEANKNLNTCQFIWNSLLKHNATRKSLLINLGGGVVGDMGGFCAATYMRGIDFIQIPTTLLSQVDASVGGKVGVDFNAFKNMIGLFTNPKVVFIHHPFLKTLPPRQWKNGYVEMLKHALIAYPDPVDLLGIIGSELESITPKAVYDSVKIKADIVTKDPYDLGLRRILNFGHTIGHAVESMCLSRDIDVLHGEAVAFGILAEAQLSYQSCQLTENALSYIVDLVRPFATSVVRVEDVDDIIYRMTKDKKNANNQILFVLLSKFGKVKYDQVVSENEINNAIHFAISKTHH